MHDPDGVDGDRAAVAAEADGIDRESAMVPSSSTDNVPSRLNTTIGTALIVSLITGSDLNTLNG